MSTFLFIWSILAVTVFVFTTTSNKNTAQGQGCFCDSIICMQQCVSGSVRADIHLTIRLLESGANAFLLPLNNATVYSPFIKLFVLTVYHKLFDICFHHINFCLNCVEVNGVLSFSQMQESQQFHLLNVQCIIQTCSSDTQMCNTCEPAAYMQLTNISVYAGLKFIRCYQCAKNENHSCSNQPRASNAENLMGITHHEGFCKWRPCSKNFSLKLSSFIGTCTNEFDGYITVTHPRRQSKNIAPKSLYSVHRL